MKFIKIRSWLLGILMFLFGVFKLVDPFNRWFHVQLINSGIGDVALPFGIAAETITGLILLWAMIFKDKMSHRSFFVFIIFGSCLVVLTMTVAIYVHLQPNVPEAVLPLGIKPPVIPLSVLVLAAANILYTLKLYKTTSKLI